MLRLAALSTLWLASALGGGAETLQPTRADGPALEEAEALGSPPAHAASARTPQPPASPLLARLPAPSIAPDAVAERPSQTRPATHPRWRRIARLRSDHASDP